MFPYPEHYRVAAPPIITGAMVVWALLSRLVFGDASTYSLYPLLALFPLVILLHLILIWDARSMGRLDQSFYALVHCSLAFVVWTFCIMHVNGHGFS
ncbi:hypothetical protein CXF83_05065 [Shewanella sp. Choline-02u-19]|uniref:hypothetical protein n=1 Tax=Shewanella TaxID=22 RepID=UPI000C3309FE|nr:MULTISPECIES: hypothetical protein [Shewanella]MCL1057534.1 hypothetical protein [Shewanella gelidimarina]PKG56522.1 hypothetical protein CXF82_14495 [Shewanella sp. GutDb-MelDb]PKG74115.1 hypothetical protein CXF86_14220 [Shewanella sp. GutCb]PKH56432.1 hypothetical protein CXF84_13410 [Shewanella sp. Bg11-22]PKI30013.1 hypothetical protein CXF83_05065 [Shewanella sp. Choline-02u-19]